MSRDGGMRSVVKVWPKDALDGERRCISVGHGWYTPKEAREHAREILAAADEGEVLLTEPKPIPDGWEQCVGRLGGGTCDEGGKWGAGVDPADHTRWRRWHAWHRASANHAFVIHQMCVEEVVDTAAQV